MPQLRILERLDQVPAADWDALHDGRNPFVAHAFLSGLERSGCLRAHWGWVPHHPSLWDDGRLVAAAPGYLKTNSHGEFVFDHAWARAYAHHGRLYYPKWLLAVPYSPVNGPRLLAADASWRAALVAQLTAHAAAGGLSSVHLNFLSGQDEDALDATWLGRQDLQYHWRNQAGWRNFEDFLAAMDHKHRKNIRQERLRARRDGVEFRVVHGDEASERDLAAMHGFYLRTFQDYGNAPALSLEFLHGLAHDLPRALVLVLAERAGQPIAGAWCLRGGDTLYGRYWGANETRPGLHFETCYYQGIEYCLREGLLAFEPGAQGEHKIARGFLPTRVRSRHWVADAGFAQALARWCEEETQAIDAYAQALRTRSPFRCAPAA